MAKSKKVEKETRKVLEALNDMVKKKGDRYKFKSKNKKAIKKVKKQCLHWIIRKGKEAPLVISNPDRPGYWKCTLCEHSFPIKPMPQRDYTNAGADFMEAVDQMAFWAVKMGGDAEDTKMFLRLKSDIPRFMKVSEQILKQVNKRDAWDKNREKSDTLQQFDMYGGFSYKQ